MENDDEGGLGHGGVEDRVLVFVEVTLGVRVVVGDVVDAIFTGLQFNRDFGGLGGIRGGHDLGGDNLA